ncbi:MAG: hypothetical protein CSA75_03025 [Sorangium cellulosum]|nr:MAG: hypothetical protein CSA75_03025 [Sorangium cellulosum]
MRYNVYPIDFERHPLMEEHSLQSAASTRLDLVPAFAKSCPNTNTVSRIHLAILTIATLLVGLVASPVWPNATWRVAFIALTALTTVIAIIFTRKRPNHPSRSLIVDANGIGLEHSKDLRPLLALSPQFGLTLLASADRASLVVAISSSTGSLCIGSNLDEPSDKQVDALLQHAATVCREELDMATQTAEGVALWVAPASLLRLVKALTRIDADAVGRFILTDTQGRQILLDHDRLLTPRCTIRLDEPFEWQGFRFNEGVGSMDAEFQGTWVRQGENELALVSLMNADVRVSIHDLCGGHPQSVEQDARLVDCPHISPPPLEQRIAVDRLFMLPLRRALDTAHVETHNSLS